MDYLIYIGEGSALPDIPAHNLTKDEADQFGIDFLLASGLYKLAETPKAKATAKKSQEVDNDSNNT